MAEIRVPTLGESVTEATIGKWFKKPGDAVAVDEPLVELETDKVTIEVPAPAAGVLGEIVAKDGETVGVGALLGQITEGAGAAPTGKPDQKTETTKPVAADERRKVPSVPGAKEMVSIRIDRDVLDHFQEDGPGWQDRINAALRKAAEL